MPKPRSLRVGADSRQAVEFAVRAVKAAYSRGQTIWRDHPEGVPSGGWFDKESRRTGIHPCTLRRARQIADPKTGLTKDELKALFALSRKHRHALTPTVLYRAMVVTNRRTRFRFLQDAIQQGWALNQALLELAEMRGRSIASKTGRLKMRKGRAGSGKPPAVASTAEGVLGQISRMAVHWTRWFARLTEEQVPGEPTGHAALADLPPAAQKALKGITTAMQDLNTIVERQLRR